MDWCGEATKTFLGPTWDKKFSSWTIVDVSRGTEVQYLLQQQDRTATPTHRIQPNVLGHLRQTLCQHHTRQSGLVMLQGNSFEYLE